MFSVFDIHPHKENIIRTILQSQIADSNLAKTATNVTDNLNRKVKRSFFRGRRRFVRYGLLVSNVLLLVAVASFIIISRNAEANSPTPALSLSTEGDLSNPLDALSGAEIAVNVARLTGMPQTTAVINHADSASAQVDVVTSGSQTVAKPQILRTELKSKNDIQEYVVAEGDTIDSIAAKFGVSSNSIRWSNDVTQSTLEVGATLSIPPVEGIVYKVKGGDTPATLASKYRSDEARITAFNDAEINGLVEGDSIVIPDGEIVVPRYTAFTGFTAVYGPSNGYDSGYCTWYAAKRRAELGRPIPANLGNACTWASRARAVGLVVNNAPAPGAVVQTSARCLGHVAVVEVVNGDGIWISEMNSHGQVSMTDPTPAGGWGRVDWKFIPMDRASSFSYIH